MISSNQILFYKIITVIIGFIIVYWGYSLFKKGIFSESGNLIATWGSKSLLLKKAAPGTFFSLFGVIIILLAIFKGIRLESYSKNIPTTITVPEKNKINFDDSSFQAPVQIMNFDSLFNLGQKKLKEKKHIEALKYFYITKGILYSRNQSDSLMKEIDYKIANCEQALTNSLKDIEAVKLSDVLQKEETKSININERSIDTIK
jgi:hypothetical protein